MVAGRRGWSCTLATVRTWIALHISACFVIHIGAYLGPRSQRISFNGLGSTNCYSFHGTGTEYEDQISSIHPMVQPISKNDGSIIRERSSVFVRVRSMSPRPLLLYKVVDAPDEPIDVRVEVTERTGEGIAVRATDPSSLTRMPSEMSTNSIGTQGQLSGTTAGVLKPFGSLIFGTLPGTHFFFIAQGDQSAGGDSPRTALGTFTIDSHHQSSEYVVLYDDESVYKPIEEDKEFLQTELQFMNRYRANTGDLWRHHFGFFGARSKPKLPMWPQDKGLATKHTVKSSAGYWVKDSKKGLVQRNEPVPLTLQAVSMKPRAFVIENFLSDAEVETVVELARPNLLQSLVGSETDGGSRRSHVRTSTNTWLSRDSSVVTETIYDRAADVLGVPRGYLSKRANAVEDLQIVHYGLTEKYNAHYDWTIGDDSHSRFITLLIYLSDMPCAEAGGETAFPKAQMSYDGNRWSSSDSSHSSSGSSQVSQVTGATSQSQSTRSQPESSSGFKIAPVKGSAVLFYNLLEDGNGDDHSLHASLPVKIGEKWLANLWVWD